MTILSCIVPVSRMANELGELESWIRDSSNLDIEIVIVHDIQDNETAEQLGSLIKDLQDYRVKFIQENVNSPGLARNLGLRIAQGQWIAFWDSDDLPDVKEALASINENLDSDIIVGRYTTHQRSSGSEEVSNESDLNLRKVGINPGMWRMLFRNNVLADKQFSSIQMAEDQVFIAELNFDSRSVSFTNRVLYKYFKGRPNQLTNSELRITDFLTAFELILIAQKQQKSPLHSINFVMLSRILVTTFKKFGINGLLRLSERLDRGKLKVTFREKCAIGINIVGIGLQRIQK
jgi:glycosyltransferase involved in cell wall biosynthesis